MARSPLSRWNHALALATALTMTVAGCGRSTPSPAPATQQPAAQQPAAEQPAAKPAERPTVKLAFIGALSGGNARAGLGGRNSAQLRLNQVNADDSFKYRYEMISLDDECKPQAGVQQATKAGSDPSIIGVIGYYCSVVALASVETHDRLGLPLVVWAAIHPDITYGNDFEEVFRVSGTQIQQNQFAANFAAKQLGFKRVAALHDTTDYGRGQFKYFRQFAEPLGVEFVSVHAVGPEQQDFTAELTEIKAKNPDVIWVGALTPVGVRVRTQMDRVGIKVPFQGTSGILNEEYNAALGAELAEGSLAFREGKPTEELPGGQKFLADFEKEGFRDPPEAYGPFAYVAADLYVQAIEAVGPDRAKVVDWLQANVKNMDTIIGRVNFDDHGQNDVPLVTAFVSQDGVWVPWDKSEYATGQRKIR